MNLSFIIDNIANICYNVKSESGTAPITKNGIHELNILTSITKGATPIEKNVIVVDSQGNEYEATYPKRAKGLVKSGRARFVGENKICLACPPNDDLEDKKMSENINTVVTETEKEITASSILKEIANIQKDNSHIFEALNHLEDVKSEGPGDIGAEEKAKAIADVVKCRETTNQRLIDFYEKAYFDCITKEKINRQEKIDTIKNLWLTYLDEATTCAFEDDRMEIINQVHSQINLLVMDIMADKI